MVQDNVLASARERELLQLESALCSATSRISTEYIRLPVAGGRAVARERLYCYELYHQLRCALGDQFGFSLGGEVDKRGNPTMQGPGLTNTKPDLLFHRPGEGKRGNLAILEVKSASVRDKRPIRKDLVTLTAFRGAGYNRAWYLFFGGTEQDARWIQSRCVRLADTPGECPINLGKIALLWHASAGTPAVELPWR